jgi:hypothetical protein
MHHDTKVCEDLQWQGHCKDDVTWYNSQGHQVTISKDPSSPWPFAPPPDHKVRANGTMKCTILPNLPSRSYSYFVDGCPEAPATPRTVIIS